MPTLNHYSIDYTQKSLPWDEVEKRIQQEINWLRSRVDTFRNEERNLPPNTCKNCLLRQLAKFLD